MKKFFGRFSGQFLGGESSWFSKLTQYVLYAVILYLLMVRVPGWIELYKMKGAQAQVFLTTDTNGNGLALPLAGQKQIFIFWATWCGPCTYELSRVNDAIKAGELKAANVFAISLGETPGLVTDTARERGYSMRVVSDTSGVSGSLYKVAGTPTTVFVDEAGKVQWASTGVSPTLIAKAREFLR